VADPDTAVADALDHLSDGPTRLAGMPDPGGPSPFGSMARRDAVTIMSQAVASRLPDDPALTQTNRTAIQHRFDRIMAGLDEADSYTGVAIAHRAIGLNG